MSQDLFSSRDERAAIFQPTKQLPASFPLIPHFTTPDMANWGPRVVLGINPEHKHFKCQGKGKKGLTYGNSISMGDIDNINDILDGMSKMSI